MAIITAPTIKSFLTLCSYSALRNGHIIQGLSVFLKGCKFLEGRDCDLVIVMYLKPNTALDIGAEAQFVEKRNSVE